MEHLPLGHDCLPVPVDVLDRVFHGDDVAVPAVVDPVDHAGQGGGLARARGSCHKHQSAVSIVPPLRVVRQGQDVLRYPQVPRIRQLEADDADYRRKRPPLAEHIDPEAPAGEALPSGHGEGEVVILPGLQPGPAPPGLRVNLLHQLPDIPGHKRSRVHPRLYAVSFHCHRQSRYQKDVRHILVPHRLLQNLLQFHILSTLLFSAPPYRHSRRKRSVHPIPSARDSDPPPAPIPSVSASSLHADARLR